MTKKSSEDLARETDIFIKMNGAEVCAALAAMETLKRGYLVNPELEKAGGLLADELNSALDKMYAAICAVTGRPRPELNL